MPRTSLPRARALLSALVLVGVVGTTMVSTAAPAAAAEVPDTPATTFQAVLEALEQLRAKGADEKAGCREAGDSNDVPRVVADIFRCRAEEAGYSAADAKRIAVEAVVVAQCESLFDADVVVFDGRYLDTPHPRTGSRYSAAGVFQFIRSTADKWIEGGYAEVTDARRNIDAAARLYLHNRDQGIPGWNDWACAAAHDGFKVGSVLPGWPGGPQHLPAWAYRYIQ